MWHHRKLPCDYCQQLLLFSTLFFKAVGLEQKVVCGKIKMDGQIALEKTGIWSFGIFYDATYHIFQSPSNERWAPLNTTGSSSDWRSWLLDKVCSVQRLIQQNPADHTPTYLKQHWYIPLSHAQTHIYPLFVPLMDLHIIWDMCTPCAFVSFTELFNVFRLIF